MQFSRELRHKSYRFYDTNPIGFVTQILQVLRHNSYKFRFQGFLYVCLENGVEVFWKQKTSKSGASQL